MMQADIRVEKATSTKINSVDFNNIVFGRQFTDHMFVCDYKDGAWGNARVQPYGDLSLSPSLSALHYGQSIFEGMKAYKSPEGEALFFRPEENWSRLNVSAERMCMPQIPKELFIGGLKKLIALDKDWIPSIDGSSLYIRPFMFATDDFLGVKDSDTYTFIIYCCPVNAYYSGALKVKVEEEYSRAAPGGVGFTKCAGNYAAAMLPTKKAKAEGYDQILWTDAMEHKYLEETGTTNFFAIIDDKVVTAEVNELLLSGITRKSVIALLKHNGMEVEERKISIDELVQAHSNGSLKECFATGTAATIVGIQSFGYRGKQYEVPTGEDTITEKVKKQITDIKTGKAEDIFNWVETL